MYMLLLNGNTFIWKVNERFNVCLLLKLIITMLISFKKIIIKRGLVAGTPYSTKYGISSRALFFKSTRMKKEF